MDKYVYEQNKRAQSLLLKKTTGNPIKTQLNKMRFDKKQIVEIQNKIETYNLDNKEISSAIEYLCSITLDENKVPALLSALSQYAEQNGYKMDFDTLLKTVSEKALNGYFSLLEENYSLGREDATDILCYTASGISENNVPIPTDSVIEKTYSVTDPSVREFLESSNTDPDELSVFYESFCGVSKNPQFVINKMQELSLEYGIDFNEFSQNADAATFLDRLAERLKVDKLELRGALCAD